MLKKFGNSFCLIQHVQIMLEHISKHFYQKLLSQVTFSGFPASLLKEFMFFASVCIYVSVCNWDNSKSYDSLFRTLAVSDHCHSISCLVWFWYLNKLGKTQTSTNLLTRKNIFVDQVRLRQKYYAPQSRPDWGSNSWPPDHDSTFHVTGTPVLTTWPSVTLHGENIMISN